MTRRKPQFSDSLLEFTAKVFDAENTELPLNVTWSVQNPNAGNIRPSGVFTAGTVPGAFQNAVVASTPDGFVTASTLVAVHDPGPGLPSRIVIAPVNPVVPLGGTAKFKATAYDSHNKKLRTKVTWTLDNPDAGTIDSKGVFKAGTLAGTYEDTVTAATVDGTVYAYTSVTVFKPFVGGNYVGALSGDVTGDMAMAASKSKFKALIMVPEKNAVFNVPGKVDPSGKVSGSASIKGTKVTFTGQLTERGASGDWTATGEPDGVTTGSWEVQPSNASSQLGTCSFKVPVDMNGTTRIRTVKGTVGAVVLDDGTLSGMMTYSLSRETYVATFSGTWDPKTLEIQIASDSGDMVFIADGLMTSSGASGTIYDSGGVPVGTWSTKNL